MANGNIFSGLKVVDFASFIAGPGAAVMAANVNPIFTRVRLARRIPVRVHIDEMPPGVILSAGMTATAEIAVRDHGRGT